MKGRLEVGRVSCGVQARYAGFVRTLTDSLTPNFRSSIPNIPALRLEVGDNARCTFGPLLWVPGDCMFKLVRIIYRGLG